MKPLYVLLVGVAVGWAVSGVDWNHEAVGQESSPPAAGAERSIRRGEGVLRRRGLLPQREAATPTPSTDAPAFAPAGEGEPMPYVPPGFDAQQKPAINTPLIGEPISGPIIEPAQGTSPAAIQINRYQISAYASQSNNGAYVIDSATGKVWRVSAGMKPVLVTDQLPEN